MIRQTGNENTQTYQVEIVSNWVLFSVELLDWGPH